VIRKARQMGFTEIMLGVKLLHFASLITSTSVYTLPKWKKAKEFAYERLQMLGLATNPRRVSPEVCKHLVDWNKTLLTKHVKPLKGGGYSTIAITGSGNEDLGESTATDAVYFDEIDRMRPGVISAFRKSLSSSYYALTRIFSTPTFPKHGVDGVYQRSDKKRWHYKCTHCGEWQHLTRANIIQRLGSDSLIQRLEAHDPTAVFKNGSFRIACLKCKKTIDRHNAKAEWVAELPSVTEYSGYSCSQLDCLWLSGDAIMRDLVDLKPGLGPWMNYDLGMPWLGDAGSVVEGWIFTLVNPALPRVQDRIWYDDHCTNLKITIGVDWGKTSWVVVLATCNEWDRPAILAVGNFHDTQNPDDTWQWVLDVCKRWGKNEAPNAVVADVGYGQDRNPHLYKALGNIFYACQYPATRSTARKPVTVEPSFGPNPPPIADPNPVCIIDRTTSLKERLARLKARSYHVAPMSEDDLETLDRHCRGIAIVIEEADDGTVQETATKIGDDHYLHALNYAEIAMKWANLHAVKLAEAEIPIQGLYEEQDTGIPTFSDICDQLGFVMDDVSDWNY
jgi:hypothetical protein